MARFNGNTDFPPWIIPRNDTYEFRYPGDIRPVVVPIAPLIRLTELYQKISNDLEHQTLVSTRLYWSYFPQISSRKAHADDHVTSPRVLCILTDGFEVIFRTAAFQTLVTYFCVTKINWAQQHLQNNFNYPIEIEGNTTKYMTIDRNGFSLVNENSNHLQRNQVEVRLPVIALVHLWILFRSVIRDLQNTTTTGNRHWEHENCQVQCLLVHGAAPYKVLSFENNTNQNIVTVNIQETSFRNMLKRATGLANLPGDLPVSLSLRHILSTYENQQKSIDFSNDFQHFRLLNKEYELDTLPMIALNDLLERRKEIMTFFSTNIDNNAGNYGTIYWSNEMYAIKAGYYPDIKKNVLQFIRQENNDWFFVITEPTFSSLLDLYQQERA